MDIGVYHERIGRMNPRRILSSVRSATRVGLYGAAVTAVSKLVFPFMETNEQNGRVKALRDSYQTHMRVLTRPGMGRVLAKAELEDWVTLPIFATTIPLDLLRIARKRRAGVKRLPVRPPDRFPYPEYYLTDFHNQANGNLSLRSALTYEWQIRFLFLGTNRLMRQGVIDELPEGNDLDVLDIGCGTAAWVTQARLQNRGHRITGIDLSPDYLRVAKTFRGRNATFIQMNAESLAPEWHGRFDRVIVIWLYHELPPASVERTTVEIARVLKPGGKLIFMEALQPGDVSGRDLAQSNRSFRESFNEPYFLDYEKLDLVTHFAKHGLVVEKSVPWYASKVVVVSKPT